MIRIPLVRLPDADNVLVADLGRMTKIGEMVPVLLRALHIHESCVPVSVFNCRLRPPVRPYAELGVTKPLGHRIGLQRSTCRLKWVPFRSTHASDLRHSDCGTGSAN